MGTRSYSFPDAIASSGAPEHDKAHYCRQVHGYAGGECIFFRLVASKHCHPIHDDLVCPEDHALLYLPVHVKGNERSQHHVYIRLSQGEIQQKECAHKVLLVRESRLIVLRCGLARSQAGVVERGVVHRTPVVYGATWPESHSHIKSIPLDATSETEDVA